MLMDTMGNDSLESDGMDMRKEKIFGNKRGNFLGNVLDDIGGLRRTMPSRLLVISTTLPHGFAHTLGSIMQRSGEPGDALATFFLYLRANQVMNVLQTEHACIESATLGIEVLNIRHHGAGTNAPIRVLPST
jgi:hypothetical protein